MYIDAETIIKLAAPVAAVRLSAEEVRDPLNEERDAGE